MTATGGAPVVEQGVVELALVVLGALEAAVVVAQLEDLELAEGVVEVEHVMTAAQRLAVGGHLRQIRTLHEQAGRLVDAHTAAVHADGGHEAAVAQQSVAELHQLEARIVRSARSRPPASSARHSGPSLRRSPASGRPPAAPNGPPCGAGCGRSGPGRLHGPRRSRRSRGSGSAARPPAARRSSPVAAG